MPISTGRTRAILRLAAAAAVLALGLGFALLPSRAAAFSPTITVTTSADTVAADGQCSLREAIANANSNAAPNADCDAGLGHEIIVFSLALGSATITLGSELPTLTDTNGLAIDGQGRITVSGNDVTRILTVGYHVPLTLTAVTFSHGNAGTIGFGGAINSQGPLVITDSAFSANRAAGGGAIRSYIAPLTIVSSVFSDNTATVDGSALYTVGDSVTVSGSTFSGNHGTAAAVYSATTISGSTFTGNSSSLTTGTIATNAVVTIDASTLSNNVGRAVWLSPSGDVTITGSSLIGNAADNGGGVYSEGTLRIRTSSVRGNTATGGGGGIYDTGTLEVTNSTIAANTATDLGGGIRTSGTVSLTNATVAANSAGSGGSGIFVDGAVVHLVNTLVSNNVSGTDCAVDGGSVTGNHNLIRATGANACGLVDGASGNIVGVDPHLGPLTGSPAYLPVGPASAARDAGDDTACTAAPVNGTSQNGVARPDGIHCDIGAYELHLATATFRSSGPQDGWVRETTERSGTGGAFDATATTLRLGDDVARRQYRAVLSFATGATLPDDAVITRVTLRVRRAGVTGGGNPVAAFGGFIVALRRGPFGTASLKAADFRAAATRSAGPFAPALTGGWYRLPLTPASSGINRLATGSGLTQVRLRFRKDDDNNARANYLMFASGNASASSQPQLIVEYYVP